MRTLHPALIARCHLPSPLGPMLAVATERGIAGLWFDGQKHHPGPLAVADDPAQRWLVRLRDALAAYWASDAGGEPLDTPARLDLPLDLHGTPFQRTVWRALMQVGRGRTTSYGELAQAAGFGPAVRAVAGAVGRNPVSIVVPCHRVIGRDGTLTGYAGGLQRKEALLRLERRALTEPVPA